MSAPIFLFATLAAIVPLAILAKWLKLPYPIVFVVGGGLIAFVPGLPHVAIAPDWIFYTVLAAAALPWRLGNRLDAAAPEPAAGYVLAVGLVIVSTVLPVAATIEWLAPGFGWASAFVLGAIVSPPDAVAAGAIFERFGIPRRIMAMLDGEGLLNDGTALVIYRFAVAAAATGAFSLPQASASFVYVVIVGIGDRLRLRADRRGAVRAALRASTSATRRSTCLITLVVPYVTYLSADAIHASGVLATVTVGIILGRRSSSFAPPETRLVSQSTWNILIYLLNALVFLLIGIELRDILADSATIVRWLPTALIITAMLIVLRLAWAFAQAYIPRALNKQERINDPVPWRWVAVIGWTGLRGIVSLAAALALPLHDAAGDHFPRRAAIIFIAFCVIVLTLVGQGLSLIPILKWFNLEDGEDTERYETKFV